MNFMTCTVGSILELETEHMTEIPKLWEKFRFGPLIGMCSKVEDTKIEMIVTSNSVYQERGLK